MKKCEVGGCERAHHCKGRCKYHYHHEYNREYHKNYVRSEKYKAYQREYKRRPEVLARANELRKTPERRARRYRGSEVGFTRALDAQLNTLQQNGCAICRVPFSSGPAQRCRDHDHATNEPRGLLCAICNLTLGQYEKFQRGAITIDAYEMYLEKTPVSRL